MSAVDVVVPCYNYARFLSQCVASVLEQEGPEVRVLVIDDASTDDSEAVGRGWARRDARVEFRRHRTNRGHIATYNEGLLGWASAPYSLLLSADDALAPAALARATGLMDRHRAVGMTYGMALVVTEGPLPPMASGPAVDCRIATGPEFLEHCCARAGNPVPTPTAVVRTALQQRLGGYRSDLPHAGDLEMWMRFAAHGPVGVVLAVQAYYRRHAASMSVDYYEDGLRHQRQVKDACEGALSCWGADHPDATRWRASVSRRVRERALRLASRALDDGDIVRFRECLQFAAAADPLVGGSRSRWRLRAKQVMPRPVWHRLRAVRAAVRHVASRPPETAAAAGDGAGSVIGSWPDAAAG